MLPFIPHAECNRVQKEVRLCLERCSTFPLRSPGRVVMARRTGLPVRSLLSCAIRILIQAAHEKSHSNGHGEYEQEVEGERTTLTVSCKRSSSLCNITEFAACSGSTGT